MHATQENQMVTIISPVNAVILNFYPGNITENPELPKFSNNLSNTEITKIYRNSCSRQNFSSRLVCRLSDEQTRKTSNAAGKLG